jgi:hypothetical protein
LKIDITAREKKAGRRKYIPKPFNEADNDLIVAA